MLAGLFTTGLVVGYFWLLTGRMAAVERLVADRWLELRERERYIRHLVDNTGDAIFLCDQQGTILDVNSARLREPGISACRVAVADSRRRGTAGRSGRVEAVAETPPATPRKRYEAVHRRKDGTTFPVEVYTTSVGIGRQQLVLAIVRDVTDRKRAEETSSEKQQPSADMAELPENVAQQLSSPPWIPFRRPTGCTRAIRKRPERVRGGRAAAA